MTIRKEDNIVVKPQVSGRVEGRSDYVFYSFDKESAQFIIAFVDANDKPLDLLNANPTVLLIIEEDGKQKKFVLDGTDMKEVSIIDGKVAFIIPDFLLGYRGKVEMYIGVTFADGSSSDELHLAFTMKESPFNAAYEEAKNYYVASFEMLLHEVELAKTTAINDINKQLPEIKKKLSDVESRIEIAEQNVDEVMEKTELHEMYSNSIDFGDYDYSGNPNLITNLSYSDISTSWTQEGSAPIPPSSDLVIDNGDSFTVDLSKFTGNLGLYFNNLPRPLVGKNYAWSIELKSEEPLAGNVFFVRPVYTNASGILSAYAKPINKGATTEMTRYSTTYTNITDIISNSKCQSLQMYFPKELPRTKVTIKYNIKVEQVLSTSDTATPYQPNLLVEPYYLSKTVLGKNIRRTDVGNSLPRTTTEYQCYVGNIEGYYEANQDYVITMKATKPATQTFGLYLLAGSQHAGNLMPVEGLTDTWQLNFRPTKEMIDAGVRNQINIFQVPQSTKGEVKIEWIKLEKGDIRTPNIEQYKYRGIGMRDSNSPKDYVWDLAPEYVEDNLATDVKISEITGKANNYTDNSIAAVNTNIVNTADDLARQINSNKTAAESYADTKKTEAVNDSKKYTDEAITNITPNRTSLRIESGFSDGFTGWVTFERIGDIVIVSYALSPSTNTGTWKTPLPIASIPEEFHFNSNAYSTGSIATSNISNDVCQAGMNDKGLQFASWNRTAGIAQFAGQVTGAVKSREK
ncbi:BppU family phage baseplate upper protein [Enterococcus lactis]|uniref:BppU family phage baseplate upper protein n=1 Tax=Enterococcus lactis TaxID=357441 RepID=UPI00254C8150|nr:BppU family phage baseplate upper protein [Enterococcus lactis]